MRANLMATFSLVDEMSSRLDSIANSGGNVVEQWESAGSSMSSYFGTVTTCSSQTAHSIDDVSSSVDGYQLSTNIATTSTDQWAGALEAQSSTAVQTAESIGDLGNQSEVAAEQAETFGNSSVNAIQGLSKVLVAAGIFTALKSIYEGFMDCSSAAADFEVTTAKVATVADTTQMSIDNISGSILDLSSDTGKAAANISDAVYQAISAGVDTAHSVEFAGTASKLAAGGFTEAATAVDVLTTAINAYNLESSDAYQISDMLIVTQNLGKTTVDELASSVGKVIPLAAAYGVEMDNLSTGYAQLTAGGIATVEAGTYLKSMLSELGNSSSEVATTLQEETGQSFAMLMEQGYSLGDVLDVLGDSVGGDTTKFNELWSSTEAGVGALALFNSGSEEFNSVLEQMRNSAGATAKAYGTMSDTTAHAHEKMENSVDNLQVSIGTALNPVIKTTYDLISNLVDGITGFVEANPAVVSAITAAAAVVGVAVVGITAYSAVTTVATTVTAALGATTAAVFWPITAIVAGVAALAAGTAVLINCLSEQNAEYDAWTASTKKQYNELEALNSEYDKACEQYEENSDKVLELRYEIDELTSSFEANKKTTEEFLAECNALTQSHDELMESYQKGLVDINAEEQGTLALIHKLDELASQTVTTAAEQEQMKTIINELNKSMPDLALSYDEVTNSVEASVEAYRKAAEAQAEQLRYQESFETYTNALKEQQALADKVAEAEANLTEERKRAQDNFWLGTSNTDDPFVRWLSDCDEYEEALKEQEINLAENKDLIAKCAEEYENIVQAAEDARNAQVGYEDAVANSLDSIQGEMDELITKYDEAYAAARDSIDGTVGLFEKAETEAGLSSKAIIEAWQTQIDFFNQYSDSLNQLENLGVDPELLKELSDGSAESINQVQSLADELGKLDASGAEAAVDNINAKFGELATAKDTAADTMASIQTDFEKALGDMEQELNASIVKMNMETEAKEAASRTISGYIQAIKNGQQGAVSAAQAVADATSAALANSYNVTTGNVTSTLPGVGYATGTASAASGLALVGEEGPELINFGGGEAVYTASETANMLSQKPFSTSVPDSFNNVTDSVNSESGGTSEKRIKLEIAGSGEIGIDSSMSEEEVVGILYNYVKPVLASIIKQEIYEEGDLAYDY